MPVTIDGANFGTSGTVTFAGQALPAAAVSSWSQTAIVVTEPAGGGANVPVDVTVAGQTSNALDFSYDPPSITSVSALQGYVGGGTTVTLSGTDFGVDATSDTVTFGGAQATITAASTTQITVLTPAGTGSVTIDVSVDGQAAGAAQSFAYLNYTSPGSYGANGLGPGTPAAPGFYVPGYGELRNWKPSRAATTQGPATSRRSLQTRATSSVQSAKRPRRQHRREATIPAPAMWRRSLRSLAFSSR